MKCALRLSVISKSNWIEALSKVICVCCDFDAECYVDFANFCILNFVGDERGSKILHQGAA